METMDQFQAGTTGKLISLAAYRRRRGLQAMPVAPCAEPGRGETVCFITGGRFEAMVNGVAGLVTAGDFLRVPAGAAYSLRDVGTLPGTFIAHQFRCSPPAQCLREMAEALPLFARHFPPAGSSALRRLKAIARRYRVVFEIEAA